MTRAHPSRTLGRTLAIAIAATFMIAAAAATASAEDQKPGAPGSASEVSAGTDGEQGCPYAKDGAPCCASCREKAAQAATGDGKAAAPASEEGGCPCQRRALLQQKAAEAAAP